MSESPEQHVVDLEAESEWRFELEADENIAVRTLSPDSVYINSEEIPPTTWYPLHRNLKASIYAAQPTKLQVSTPPASNYSSSSTSQSSLVALHLALERIRILARRQLSNGHASSSHQSPNDGPSRGPAIMILGPPSSGKTTVVKNLVNMALGTGMSWTPGVISLDPSSPANLIPGSLSLSTPSHPIPTHHLAHPLGSPPTSVPANTLGADVPTLGWWYGHPEPSNKGVDLWKKLVAGIGERWKERCAKDPTALASGLFVDTPSAFTNALLGTRKDNPKAKYSLVADAVEQLEIDTIAVIGHEKLTIDLTRLFPNVRVIRLPRSSGTVDLDDANRQIVAAAQVRSYFYGEPSLPKEIENLSGRMVAREGNLIPYSFQIGWETLTILRVGEENAAPSTALPLGSSRILSPTRLTRVDPAGPAQITRLLNCVLAVVAIRPGDRIKKKDKGLGTATMVKDEPEGAGQVKVEKVEGPSEETAEGAVEAEISEAADKAQDEGAAKEHTEIKSETDVQDQGQTKDISGDPGAALAEKEHEGEGDGDEDDEEDEDEVPYLEEIGYRETLGFVVITAIDTLRKKYTVLSPSPGKLPSTVAIAGSIEWVDSE
ncbi:hypothetical protein BD324DRAFT_621467 [Kockovaella imperatae]|uniref:Polynucleotide 5'-hydroxyl-kinase GRC3 n=1 Tax=Kockovaella imperatae TaxID=4999 RepID=A0A1Y1UKT4_9TREE|nr:hypothetical protein BD324DRAFT_621467 [Kockovaella imperatae]ORX38582.1 hypothetical protein BD324DRAFT_621467 [Kockovaella imperatae]